MGTKSDDVGGGKKENQIDGTGNAGREVAKKMKKEKKPNEGVGLSEKKQKGITDGQVCKARRYLNEKNVWPVGLDSPALLTWCGTCRRNQEVRRGRGKKGRESWR